MLNPKSSKVTEALQESKHQVLLLKAKLSSGETLTRNRLRAFLSHSNQIVGALINLVDRVPASGLGGGGAARRRLVSAKVCVCVSLSPFLSQFLSLCLSLSLLPPLHISHPHHMPSALFSCTRVCVRTCVSLCVCICVCVRTRKAWQRNNRS